MPRRKKISDISIELSEEQKKYLQNETAGNVEVGVKKSTLRKWKREPIFSTIYGMIHYTADLLPEDFESALEQIKAAVILMIGFTFEEVETALGLPHDTLLHWGDSHNSDSEYFQRTIDYLVNEKRRETDTAELTKKDLMIPLILAGKNNQEIANELNVTRQTISKWRNDKDYQTHIKREMEDYKQTQRAHIAQVISKAYATLHQMLDAEDEAIRLKAAEAVLKHTRPQ